MSVELRVGPRAEIECVPAARGMRDIEKAEVELHGPLLVGEEQASEDFSSDGMDGRVSGICILRLGLVLVLVPATAVIEVVCGRL